MRQLIKRLKLEKVAIEKEKKERYESEAEGRERAYNTGKAVAKTWLKNSSYQQIIDFLRHYDDKRDDKNIESKSHLYFTSIENVCPEEAQEFKWAYNDSFMDGWREGVFTIWNSIRRHINNE